MKLWQYRGARTIRNAFASVTLVVMVMSIITNYASSSADEISQPDPDSNVQQTHLFLPLTGRSITTPDLLRVTESPLREIQPAISHDNRKVAYIAIDLDGATDLYVTDLTSGTTINLTNSPSIQEETPVFSPDGAAIAYGRNVGDRWDIFLIDLDGANERPLISTLSIW